ncbi:LysE family translocator [Acinetobacter puyangensis]|nr:LysE family translocator [Acinetobacter puyangensis]
MMNIENILGFSFVALMMVLTPGPNMIYLISRSICQGKKAGFISLIGVGLGFLFYMLLAALGITAILFNTPHVYDLIRILGAMYLLWLAWGAVKPSGNSPFEVKNLPHDSNLKLFSMGFLTNLLNPKIAIMYLSLLPQFIDTTGSIFYQSIILGSLQILISVMINALIVFFAGTISIFLAKNQFFSKIQRYLMGTVLFLLAVKIILNI